MHRWTLNANMNYLWERYTVENQPNQNSQLIYPSLNLTYLKTDSIVKPTYGRSLNFLLQGASQNLLSSTSFLQAELHGKILTTPVSFGRLILSGDVGYTVVHELNDLPLSMRFFAGGINSVRGYGPSSIGPGKYLGVASIEYRNHIAYDLYGAVFYDVGTATNHYGQNMVRGAGVGLVYESVVGPIKIYVARALSKPRMPHSVEFSVGPEF
jgi:translocation and assembly module TamA